MNRSLLAKPQRVPGRKEKEVKSRFVSLCPQGLVPQSITENLASVRACTSPCGYQTISLGLRRADGPCSGPELGYSPPSPPIYSHRTGGVLIPVRQTVTLSFELQFAEAPPNSYRITFPNDLPHIKHFEAKIKKEKEMK